MKTTRNALTLALLLSAATVAQSVSAAGPYRRPHYSHWHTSVGISIGVPLLGFGLYSPAFYAPFPYYYPAYYPAPVVVQQQAPVYVEQSPPPPEAQPSAPAGYWYYCAEARAYYPYVKSCPAGWQRVAPQPG